MDAPFQQAIAVAYSLEDASVIGQFESYGNENWLIEDGRGERYVLRRHRLNADIRRIEFQLALQEHLAGHGFPTSSVVETASQGRYAIDDDGIPWVLFRHVAGREYNFGLAEQVTAAARCLAEFHLVTASFEREPTAPEYKASIRHCWANATRDLGEMAELLKGGAEDELAFLAEWWHSVLREWPLQRLDALPSGWLHGDFHGRNLAFDGDEVAGVFDFDDADRGPYAYDLATGLLKFGRESRGSLRVRLGFARAFVAGYETVRPISGEERAVLPVMAAMGCPPHPRNYRYWRDQRGVDIARRFRGEVATIRALRDEMKRIGHEIV